MNEERKIFPTSETPGTVAPTAPEAPGQTNTFSGSPTSAISDFPYPPEAYAQYGIPLDRAQAALQFATRSARHHPDYFWDNYRHAANAYVKNKIEKSTKSKFSAYLKNSCDANLSNSAHPSEQNDKPLPPPVTITTISPTPVKPPAPDPVLSHSTFSHSLPHTSVATPFPAPRETALLRVAPPVADEPDEDEILLRENELRASSRKRRLLSFWVVAITLLLFAAGSILYLSADKEASTETTDDLTLVRQLEDSQVSSENFRRSDKPKTTEEDIKRLSETNPLPDNEPAQQGVPAHSTPSAHASLLTPHDSSPSSPAPHGKNYQADKNIIDKYENLNPATDPNFAGNAPPATDGLEQQNRMNRRFSRAGAAEERPGRHSAKEEYKPLVLSDQRIKAKLVISVRSSADNAIQAETVEPAEGGGIPIPRSSKFFGTASFANGRTYITFSTCRIAGTNYSINAIAVQGKDPGLAAEVSEIAGSNMAKNIAIGTIQTAASLVNGVAGRAIGESARNYTEPTAADMQKDKEAQKLDVEYRVAAGTPFFIYFQ